MHKNSSLSSQSVSASHRVFYNLPEKPDVRNDGCEKPFDDQIINNTNELKRVTPSETYYTQFFAYIERSIIGRNMVFIGPFGSRLVIYCDYTASGRSLKFIEEFIYNEVLPDYANTHTTNTATSLQTTMFRHEARDIIRNSCQASEHDAVLFVGNGCTGAIHKLIHNLNLAKPPIVLVGAFEHHSNLLPWRHLAHSTHRIMFSNDGSLDLTHLEALLIQQSKLAINESRSLLCVLAAVSNVTGIISNVNIISALVHQYKGIIFWDYAAAAPYLPIDMNPITTGSDRNLVYKDAVYFSIHKFIGGVQAPGVLIAKRALFVAGERYPDGTGGGTVFFVRRENQIYLKNVEEREEGGTPDIVGAIRAGLVFQLKESATTDAIIKREDYIVKISWSKFAQASSNLVILGGSKTHRIPIFSFLIRHQMSNGDYLFLHHNFVCALLNDLFGIQSRSGCACAGPYAMDLIGIDETLAKRFEDALVGTGMESTVLSKYFESPHREIIRPGFVRINFPYFMPDNEVNFVLDAICFVAKHGYKFLPRYSFNPVTSEWRYRDYDMFRDKKWLGHVSYRRGYMTWRRPNPKHIKDCPYSFEEIMSVVNDKLLEVTNNPIIIPDESLEFDDGTHILRWFLLPSEVATIMWNAPRVARPSRALFVPGSIAQAFFGMENEKSKVATTQNIPQNNEVVEQFKEFMERNIAGSNNNHCHMQRTRDCLSTCNKPLTSVHLSTNSVHSRVAIVELLSIIDKKTHALDTSQGKSAPQAHRLWSVQFSMAMMERKYDDASTELILQDISCVGDEIVFINRQYSLHRVMPAHLQLLICFISCCSTMAHTVKHFIYKSDGKPIDPILIDQCNLLNFVCTLTNQIYVYIHPTLTTSSQIRRRRCLCFFDSFLPIEFFLC